ncbi:hypothetical protein [Roseivirga sp.]|uniref:hypothetical protein n=1 Tax=Roseivirga sp. TaxID=1964215 RepID=UPI003B528A68
MRALIIPSICFLTFLANLSYGQSGFKEGYIISTSGSILNGEISISKSNGTPQEFRFRQNDKSEALVISKDDAYYVRSGNEIYELHQVEVDERPRQDRTFDREPQIETSMANVFIQKLYGAENSLYQYIDTEDNIRFYLMSDESLFLLTQQTYQTSEGPKTINPYKEALTELLTNCNNSTTLVENTDYSAYSLVETMASYNDCIRYTGDVYRLKIKKPAEKRLISLNLSELNLTFTPTIGISSTDLNFEGDPARYIVEANFESETALAYGLMTELRFKKDAFWGIGLTVMHTSLKASANTFRQTTSTTWVSTDNELEANYIKLQPTALFHFNLNDFSLTLGGGPSIGYGSEKRNYTRYTTKLTNNTIITEHKVYEPFLKKEKGWVALVGVLYQRHGLYFRYESGDGVSGDESMPSTTKRLYFSYGFSF